MEQKLPVFAKRLNELRGSMSQAEFGKMCGISRVTVGFYENGERLPDARILAQIAQACNVTSDYLLGLSDLRSPDYSLQGASAYTGLSEHAINNICFAATHYTGQPIKALSEMLENGLILHVFMNINENIIGKYCIVRCDRASVFAGVVAERDGQAVLIKDARRIWYWNGAASLSQLAVDGTQSPDDCKFSVVCESVVVLDAIEIIPCTDTARQSIEGVKVWRC